MRKPNDNIKLTSISVDKKMYDLFKKRTNKTKFYFTDLINKALHLYLTNSMFRDIIDNHTKLETKNSSILTNIIKTDETLKQIEETLISEPTNSLVNDTTPFSFSKPKS